MTCYYVMMDQHPHLAEKISLVSALSPISFTSHTTGLLQELSTLLVSLPHFITVINKPCGKSLDSGESPKGSWEPKKDLI